ncbi:MAG TPA: phytanoyl-CoA dioxygenase family protein [Acidimicrobiales bacterium]
MGTSRGTVVEGTTVDDYERDGVAVVRQAFDPEWIELVRSAMPTLLEDTYDPNARLGMVDGGPTIKQHDQMWRENEPFARFLFRSPIGELALRYNRSAVARLYEDLMIYTDAGDVVAARWHRDAPYWPLRGNQLTTVWFTLEPVGPATGAMRFVRGSHLDEDASSTATPSGELAAGNDSDRVLIVPTEPGDAVIFHPRILHTSYGSAADRPRRSFTIRFMGDDIRWRPRRQMYHRWMYDCGLADGDVPDHPWFPVVGRAEPAPGSDTNGDDRG